MASFSPDELAFLHTQRVGRLASADEHGQPHVIPVCYACDGTRLYIALDSKPKRVAPQQLRRVRNILSNPQVALVVDRYSDDWSELAYLLVRGQATLLPPTDPAHAAPIALLRQRYPQYQAMPIHEQPLIMIQPDAITSWGRLDG